MKVLIVPSGALAPFWRTHQPGQAEDQRRVVAILARRGIEVTLADPFGWPWNPLARRHSIFRALDPLRALRILLLERKTDVVIAYFESSALLILLLRRLLGFKALVIIHDLGLTNSWKLRERILDFVIPRADALVLLGSSQVEYVRRRWPRHGLLKCLKADVDLDFYAPQREVSDGPILAVGDDPARDFPTLLAATQDMLVDVLIKSSQVEENRQAWPKVTVLSARLSGLEYRQLFVDAAFVVLPVMPAIHASGVTTLLEAMAMGKAIIVSDSAGLRDYVVPEETALVVPCGDPAALAAAIRRLTSEPATRARLGRNARRFVEQHCSPEGQAEELDALFRSLLAAKAEAVK